VVTSSGESPEGDQRGTLNPSTAPLLARFSARGAHFPTQSSVSRGRSTATQPERSLKKLKPIALAWLPGPEFRLCTGV
jgi:hypothetical protein